jgi:hypothetical protein
LPVSIEGNDRSGATTARRYHAQPLDRIRSARRFQFPEHAQPAQQRPARSNDNRNRRNRHNLDRMTGATARPFPEVTQPQRSATASANRNDRNRDRQQAERDRSTATASRFT